jgi:signal transduction histidine kinase
VDDAEKTREQLLEELQELRGRVEELEAKSTEHNVAEERLRKLSRDLSERAKELNCLYGIASLREKRGISRVETLQGIVELIPPAWQYPEITCARLVLPIQEFKTANFQPTKWKLSFPVTVYDERIGVLEVCYLEEKPEHDEGPFLKEERKLLDVIGERINKILERQREEDQRKQQEQQLIQLDKMVALGTLVSGVAHEINNPNNFIMLNTPLLSETWESLRPILDAYHRENGDFLVGGLPYSEMRGNIPLLFSGIVEGAKRIKNIVESLKGFARMDTSDFHQEVEINTVVRSALTLINNQIKKSTERFSVEYGTNLPALQGNFQRLEQVIINLVQNACEALPNKKKGIRLSTSYDWEQNRIVVTVEDEGIGIPADKLLHITDPFYTTKRDSGGTGLGLSVSSGIVKSHGGTLSFQSAPNRGTTAVVTLPVSGDSGTGREPSR